MNKIIDYNVDNLKPDNPQPKYYNCTDCSSLIEILSINEEKNEIEFKCLNKDNNHGKKKMSIKDYLTKMEKFKKGSANGDSCKEHLSYKNNKYVSYCFDCKQNLCEECLKSRSHINHAKNNIIEIKPIKEELLIIEEIMKDYNIKIENLKKEKINKEQELNIMLENEKEEEKRRIEKEIKINENEKEKELRINVEKYSLDIKEIKEKYENEIRKRKEKFEKDNTEINNKYELKSKKEYELYDIKIKELDIKYHEMINNLKYDIKTENMINIQRINETVYNTYKDYNNNYYNADNINNILLSYYNNEYIKNKIIKRVLNNNYEEIIKIILKKRDEDIKQSKKDKEERGFEINIEIENLKEEYDKKLNEIIKEKEKEIKNIEMKFEEQIKEYKNIIKEQEDKFNMEIEIIKKQISHIFI